MSFFRKIRKFLSFEEQQSDLDEKKTEGWKSTQRWYMDLFEKDVRLQELYPQEYLQLQKELTIEEWRVIKPVIDKHMKREGLKEKLLRRFEEDETLKNQYGDIYEELPNVVSDEEVERYEVILQDYEGRRTERNQWLVYLESFPKLREKYAREYELLHNDLPEEEFRAVVVILSYERALMESLTWQYDAYIKETVETNYIAGKIEKLYKGYIRPEELMRKYPEGVEVLIKYYGPEFDEFFFAKDGKPKYADMGALYEAREHLQFQDMLFFREFIERNHVFEECVITDREYTVISNKLRFYVPDGAIRGIAGTFTGYSISYENFLAVKELYPEEVVFYASQETGADEIWRFISKVQPYLTQREIQYMV